jgi:hypothetical protein
MKQQNPGFKKAAAGSACGRLAAALQERRPLKNRHLGAGVAIIESSKNLFCAIRASRV